MPAANKDLLVAGLRVNMRIDYFSVIRVDFGIQAACATVLRPNSVQS